jgi:hypothetical protein
MKPRCHWILIAAFQDYYKTSIDSAVSLTADQQNNPLVTYELGHTRKIEVLNNVNADFCRVFSYFVQVTDLLHYCK